MLEKSTQFLAYLCVPQAAVQVKILILSNVKLSFPIIVSNVLDVWGSVYISRSARRINVKNLLKKGAGLNFGTYYMQPWKSQASLQIDAVSPEP